METAGIERWRLSREDEHVLHASKKRSEVVALQWRVDQPLLCGSYGRLEWQRCTRW